MRRTFTLIEEDASQFLRFSKGIAILLIAFHHFSRSLWLSRGLQPPNIMQWTFQPAGEGFGRIDSIFRADPFFADLVFRLSAQFGYFGVHLFVLMSGLGLAMGTPGRIAPATFLKRRFRKLIPPFWTAIVFFVLLRMAIEQPYSLRSIVERVFLLSTFDQGQFFRVDPPLWCLAVFLQLYLVFIPMRAIIARFGSRMILLFAAIGFVARLICTLPQVLNWNQNFGHVVGLNWLAVFALGIWAGNNLRKDGKVSLPIPGAALTLVCSGCLLFLSERFSTIYPIHDSVVAVVIGGVTLMVWCAISRTFVSQCLAAVGSVSFPLYLYHRPIVGMVIFQWQKHAGSQSTGAFTLSLVTMTVLIAVFLLIQRLLVNRPTLLEMTIGAEPLIPLPRTSPAEAVVQPKSNEASEPLTQE